MSNPLHLREYSKTLEIKRIRETIQAFQLIQSNVKASTANENGFQYLEQNFQLTKGT